MNLYDVTPDDEPLDLETVNTDDALVERLRLSLSPDAAVVWDDNDDEDPGYALLRAVQLDVSSDLPEDAIVPTEVTRLVPRRRHLSRTATVAVVAASVLSIGGVAAASAPGQPLAGVRHAVSDAVATAVDAITPDAPVGPAVASESPSPKSTPPGDAVSDAARSAAAVLQIEANLDRAEAMIDAGRYQPAKNQLDAAARKLHYVTDAAVRAGLQGRLTGLQSRVAAMPTAKPTAKATHGPSEDKGKPDNKGHGATDADHGGQGSDATHKPTAIPSRGARSSGNGTASDQATPDAVETPDSHKGGKS